MMECTLGYFKFEKGNVGDDLNAWLWPKVLPNIEFKEESETVLIGIGSILDSRFDNYEAKILVGSGARDSKSVPNIDNSWNAFFVRGPRTQAALKKHISVNYITDPAILIGEYFTRVELPESIGLIPYFRSNEREWQKIADALGYKLISPKNSVEDFSKQIAQCKYVITEAMHGAIFADAMRVPWFPVAGFTRFHEKDTHFFKWGDWCESMEMSFNEIELPIFWENDSLFKKILKRHQVKSIFKKIKPADCFLSEQDCYERKVQEMKLAIDELKSL